MSDRSLQKEEAEIDRLRNIMARLRDPNGGCPWDLEQDFSTIAPYTIEEAYEVADAIERNDLTDLRGELGDLLFQVVFHSQMAEEKGVFNFDDVAQAISDKMVARHPHVFGEAEQRNATEQTVAWEEIKQAEREKQSSDEKLSALSGVANALPALMRAQKLQKRAARVGFDWPSPSPIIGKIHEELEEVNEAIENKGKKEVEEELGDLLFVCVNLVRKLGGDAEEVLKSANAKFYRRFTAMESLASAAETSFAELSLDEQEALWQAVKAEERR